MIIQLFIFALMGAGFGLYALIKKKHLIGITFILLGLMLFAVGAIVVYLYPHTWPL